MRIPVLEREDTFSWPDTEMCRRAGKTALRDALIMLQLYVESRRGRRFEEDK